MLTVITGVAYPAAILAVAQVAFPSQANGSLIVVDGRTVGSSLIGQAFDQPKYFWGRPSAAGVTTTNPNGYDANSSGALQPRADEPGPHRPGHQAGRPSCGPPTGMRRSRWTS